MSFHVVANRSYIGAGRVLGRQGRRGAPLLRSLPDQQQRHHPRHHPRGGSDADPLPAGDIGGSPHPRSLCQKDETQGSPSISVCSVPFLAQSTRKTHFGCGSAALFYTPAAQACRMNGVRVSYPVSRITNPSSIRFEPAVCPNKLISELTHIPARNAYVAFSSG